MGRFARKLDQLSELLLAGFMVAGMAWGQGTQTQAIVSSRQPITATNQPTDVAEQNPDAADTTVDPASLLPDLPKLPARKASLIGGTVYKVDRVRDQFTLRIFGGGKMQLSFDPRTRIFLDGAAAAPSDLRRGDRVYADTMLDGSTVFARNIRIRRGITASESQGVVLSYRADKGELLVRDVISPQPLKLRLTADTKLLRGDRPAGVGELVAGTLVTIQFGAEPGHDVARTISILAAPGGKFTFSGRVTALDLSTGLLALTSNTDGHTYELHVDPSVVGVDDNLHIASDVTVLTRFDGNQYEAQRLTVNSPAAH